MQQGGNRVTDDTDRFIAALGELDAALDELVAIQGQMKQRIAEIRAAHAAGRRLADIVPAEDPPLLVQLLTQSAELLHSYGTTVRRTEARALHREGMTMDQIAKLFGVTRQRVSTLLRASASESDGTPLSGPSWSATGRRLPARPPR
jgi:hypothetical protein